MTTSELRVVTGPCPRCNGPLFRDTLELADKVCIWCGERYGSDMRRIRRAPTPEEMSRKQRHAYALSERRMA